MGEVGLLDNKKPLGLKWRSSTMFILSTVGVGMFTDLFLYGLVVPILPFMLQDRMGVPRSEVQGYTSGLLAAYAGASVLSSLPAGYLADRLSTRQLPFLLGLIALSGATAMLFLGQNIAVLVVARILQGVSGAVVWTVGLAMVMDTVGSANLGITIGSIFSLISFGDLIAPVLGGFVYKKAGYVGVFSMALAVLLVDISMRLLLIEKKTAAQYIIQDDEEDAEVGSAAEDEAGIQDEESPLLHNDNPNDETVSEDWKILKEPSKIVKKFPMLYCLGDGRLLASQAVAFTQAVLLGVFDATIPIEAQDLFEFDSLRAGLLFIPLVVPYLLLGPLAGKCVDKFGTKPASSIGMLYLVIPLVLLRIPQAGGINEIVKMCVFLSLCGVGFAIISAPAIVEASYVAEQYHKANPELFGEQGPYAQLYAVNSMVFSSGLTIGPLIAGHLRIRFGFGDMNAFTAGLCATVGILSFVYMGGKPSFLKKKAQS